MLHSAPRLVKPFKCKSTGLKPMLQPPGIGITALPNLPNIAPASKKDALISLAFSSLAI